MYSQSQGYGKCNSRSAHAAADWQALELQLNRTRVILQEILVHLQEVLKNLKMARHPGRPFAASARPEAAGSRFSGRDSRAGETRHRQQPGQGSAFAGRERRFASTASASQKTAGPSAGQKTAGTSAGQKAAGPSERPWTRTRPGFEARTESTQQARSGATGEDAGRRAGGEHASFRAGTSRPGPSAAGSANRERPRSESAYRTKFGATGHDRDSRFGHGAGASSGWRHASSAGASQGQTTANARSAQSSRASSAKAQERSGGGFRLDQERQSRARAAARKAGMNLKCAYDILCLDYPCSVDEIKGAYRQMARLHHPDLGGDEEAMKDVNVAYELAMRFSAGPRRAGAAWAV